ncbi:hypothetical protein ACFXPM_02755 [Streptomyces sp. NPDC059095]
MTRPSMMRGGRTHANNLRALVDAGRTDFAPVGQLGCPAADFEPAG